MNIEKWSQGLGIKAEPDPRTQEEKDQGIPLIPKLPKRVMDSNPVVAVCGECGLRIHQIMGYVCSHPSCPTGLAGPYCSVKASTAP